MSVDREIDWNLWLNKLIFCHGCGRFGMPANGKQPKGWKLLYQPHPEGRPGLYVCSTDCEEKIREAMKEGPIIDPLEMRPPPMPYELQEQVRELVKGVAEEERALQQEEALKRLQSAVDTALIAAMEANEGKPLTKREAIDVAANAIIDVHCNIGMAVTANVEIDDNGMATAEVVVVGKRDPRHLAGGIEDLPGLMDMKHLWEPYPPPGLPLGTKIPPRPSLDEPIPFSRTAKPVETDMIMKLMPPPEPEPEEEQHETEMEFVTLKKRDTKGVVIDVNFRPSYMEEEGDDGEEADERGAGGRRRKADGAHDAEARDANRADSTTDETRHLDPASEVEGREESP